MDYYVPWGITNWDELEALTSYKEALREKLEVLLERNPEDKSQIPDWAATVDEIDLKMLPNSEVADLIEQGDEWTHLINNMTGIKPRRMTEQNNQLYKNRYEKSVLTDLLQLLE